MKFTALLLSATAAVQIKNKATQEGRDTMYYHGNTYDEEIGSNNWSSDGYGGAYFADGHSEDYSYGYNYQEPRDNAAVAGMDPAAGTA